MGRIYNIDGATANVPSNLDERDPDVAVVLAALDYDDAGFKAIGAPDDNFAGVFEGMLQVCSETCGVCLPFFACWHSWCKCRQRLVARADVVLLTFSCSIS